MSMKTYSTDRAWSNYWEIGFESTFTRHEESPFFQMLGEEWREIFRSQKVAANVVDMGAGNGILSNLAAIISTDESKKLTITAIDYADIETNSPVLKNHDSIKIKSHTKIEETGLDTASADLVVSQYGFEYADSDLACKELARILKPGGKFHAIVHHKQSEVTKSCASAHMQIGLCYRSKVADYARKLLTRLRKLEKSNRDPHLDVSAQDLRLELNKRAERALQHADKFPDQAYVNEYLHDCTALFGDKATKLTFKQKLNVLDNVEENAKNYQLRMEAMLKASLDKEAVDKLVEELKTNDLDAQDAELVLHDGNIYAWRVQAQKAS